MGFEQILSSIEDDTRAQILDIEEKAQKQKEQVLREGKEKAESIRNKAIMIATEKAAAIEKREHFLAIMEARSLYRKSIKEKIDKAFFILKEESNFQDDESYAAIFASMVNKAILELGDNCNIKVAKADLEKAKKITSKANIEASNLVFGLFAESKDGKKLIDYSPNALIEYLHEDLEEAFYAKIVNNESLDVL
ncbi:MAG: hypothetical protein QXN16_01715 [Candidatus Micrarchaeaceae archaeon]